MRVYYKYIPVVETLYCGFVTYFSCTYAHMCKKQVPDSEISQKRKDTERGECYLVLSYSPPCLIFFFLFKGGDIISLNYLVFVFNCDVAPPDLTSPKLLVPSQAPWRGEPNLG